MTNPKLTPAQSEVVRKMREGETIIRTGFIDEVMTLTGVEWRISYMLVDLMEDIGLISEVDKTYTLTDLGRSTPI